MEILQATEYAWKIRENQGNAENQNIFQLTKLVGMILKIADTTGGEFVVWVAYVKEAFSLPQTDVVYHNLLRF